MLKIQTLYLLFFIILSYDTVFACVARPDGNFKWADAGGEKTTKEALPYQVQLESLGRDAKFWNLMCSAAIYNERVAITAATCVHVYRGHLEEIRIISGPRKNGMAHQIVDLRFHPKYEEGRGNAAGLEFNVALLRVDPPFKFDRNTQPIEIATEAAKVGETGVAGGWGGLQRRERIAPFDTIRAANATVIERRDCDRIYEQIFHIDIKDGCLCVSFKNKNKHHRDACLQETGAPFVVDHKLVGLQQLDESCEKLELPSVYTDVAKYEKWIKKNAKGLSN